MLTDWELWAAADSVMKQHGDRASVFVAERIGALAARGDAEGVAAWKAIARRMSELSAAPPQQLHS